ncbi:hypothetical protein F2Q70_00035755 [Brassica cretica]|uniref:Uncharacterized protein n=1 Tax=Brassica cretica TaxID=69181 RepID=A0A8S9JUI4_BRACR|nr:hypothetical protein F2Q70_00035755 [Brassica cretica]
MEIMASRMPKRASRMPKRASMSKPRSLGESYLFPSERKGGALEGWSTRQFGELDRSNSPNGRVGGLARSNSPKARVGRLGWSNLSFDEISSELTIRGRYEEEATVRRTSSAVDRYRREASTIEDYDRSMYILYHRSMSRREMRNLVHAQQYQKQQGQTPAILRRSCSLGTNDPQRPILTPNRRPTPDLHRRTMSSSTDLHSSTSIDTTPRTSIDHQSRTMVAIVILRQDENGNMYDQDGHLRNATGTVAVVAVLLVLTRDVLRVDGSSSSPLVSSSSYWPSFCSGLFLASEYGFLAGWRKKLHALVINRGDRPHLVQPGAPYDGIKWHRMIDYGEFCFQFQIDCLLRKSILLGAIGLIDLRRSRSIDSMQSDRIGVGSIVALRKLRSVS